jgi:hypothetical protein
VGRIPLLRRGRSAITTIFAVGGMVVIAYSLDRLLS